MGLTFEDLMDEICARRRPIRWIFSLSLFLLVLQLPYLAVVQPGSSLHVVSVMNAVGFGGFAAVSGLGLWRCRNR